MKTYPIPESLLNAIINILATLPWRQVVNVMGPLQQIIQADMAPPPMPPGPQPPMTNGSEHKNV